jgi:O-methyltransferase domain/Dimerisation domain
VDEPPPQKILDILFGMWRARALHIAARLELADHLADGPKSVAELASTTGMDAVAMHRLLRALASIGVFRAEGESGYANTPLSEALRTGVPGTVRDFVLCFAEEWMLETWKAFPKVIDDGVPAFDPTSGTGLFDYFHEHGAESASTFDAAMTNFSALINPMVAQAYDFSSWKRVVDVGGGEGSLLGTVLEAHPHLYGVLLDREEVVARSGRYLSALTDRSETVSGDFFDTIPGEADGYLLKHVLHDWDDKNAVRILTNVREAMPAHARLLSVEFVLTPGSGPDLPVFLDLVMLAYGGRERTEAEFAGLFQQAGLRLDRVIPLAPGAPAIVEATPA